MTTRRLFVLLFVMALFAMAVRETVDPDMWWHLRTGELILEQGIPRADPFSFTVRGTPWVAHEWLSQLLMWLLYRVGGLSALIVASAALITVTFWLVYLTCPGHPYLAAFGTLLAALASAITWGARPQMFNLLFMALFVLVVERVHRDRLSPRALILLPLLTALWANLHSGYLLGVVLLATYTAAFAVDRLRASPRGEAELATEVSDAGRVKLFLGVTVASLLAALLNPNGAQLWLYPFETLGSPAMQAYIQEWQAPNFRLPIFWPFATLFLLGVLGWVFSLRRPTTAEMLLFLGTAAASLLSARHIPLFAIVAAPIVVRAWLGLLEERAWGRALVRPAPAAPPRFVNWVLASLAVLAVLLWTTTKVATNEEAIAARYPAAAVDYLVETGLAESRGYNSYGWGGYLIWHDIPVFVDGRADVYGDAFLFYYLQALELQEGWQAPLDDYAVQYTLLHPGTPLTTMLAASDAWRRAYADELAVVFVRAGTTGGPEPAGEQ
ncbi:MAG: hypothetical protein R3272_08380 [Candidatus Promineifilaceae bacterium]|nr:hypothetical protein [Candidatus Promineifilaceae bacterium]